MQAEFKLIITTEALKKIRSLIEDKKATSAVRIGLRAGGCSGFEQKIELNPLISTEDVQVQVEDLLVVVDPKSANLLNNVSIDWAGDLTGKRFVFNLPNKVNNCSCGNSFSIKK